MIPVEILQFAILCASFFAAWKLDGISRTLGEVTTHIEHLKDDVFNLKEELVNISKRVDMAERDLQTMIKENKDE